MWSPNPQQEWSWSSDPTASHPEGKKKKNVNKNTQIWLEVRHLFHIWLILVLQMAPWVLTGVTPMHNARNSLWALQVWCKNFFEKQTKKKNPEWSNSTVRKAPALHTAGGSTTYGSLSTTRGDPWAVSEVGPEHCWVWQTPSLLYYCSSPRVFVLSSLFFYVGAQLPYRNLDNQSFSYPIHLSQFLLLIQGLTLSRIPLHFLHLCSLNSSPLPYVFNTVKSCSSKWQAFEVTGTDLRYNKRESLPSGRFVTAWGNRQKIDRGVLESEKDSDNGAACMEEKPDTA